LYKKLIVSAKNKFLKEGYMKTKAFILSMIFRGLFTTGIVLGIVLATCLVAYSAPQGFLKIEGVKGDATEKYHRGWIKVFEHKHGISGLPAPSLIAKSAPARTKGKAAAGKFVIIKAVDHVSQTISQMCTRGVRIAEVILQQRWQRGDKDVYIQYNLTNCMVSSFKPGSSSQGGETLPCEEVSFNYGEISWNYVMQEHGTDVGGNVDSGWDLEKNKDI